MYIYVIDECTMHNKPLNTTLLDDFGPREISPSCLGMGVNKSWYSIVARWCNDVIARGVKYGHFL